MKISEMLISIIIAVSMVSGISVFYFDLGTSYGKSDIQNLSFVNSSAAVFNYTPQLKGNLTKDFSFADTIFTSVGFIFGTIRVLFEFPSIVISFIADINNGISAAGIPIPGFVFGIIESVIGVYILFKIMEFFTGRDV